MAEHTDCNSTTVSGLKAECCDTDIIPNVHEEDTIESSEDEDAFNGPESKAINDCAGDLTLCLTNNPLTSVQVQALLKARLILEGCIEVIETKSPSYEKAVALVSSIIS